MRLFYLLFLFLIGCSSETNLDNLAAIKKNFISSIFESCIDEGPFQMDYHLRTILFSDNIISLLGEVFVYDHLPHGWSKMESKTYIKEGRRFREIHLDDLFPKTFQKEYLRNYCENSLRTASDQYNHFNGKEPLCNHLDWDIIKLFVVDHESLILIFQPYTVGGLVDGPFTVKITFSELRGKWQEGNPLEKQLPIDRNFISSWDRDSWTVDVAEDHSIAS